MKQAERDRLETATVRYQNNVTQARDYLQARGIDGTTAMRARLGVVVEPMSGHEDYVGRLAIPYVTPTGVVDMRFRCLSTHDCKAEGCAKYLSLPGHKSRLYNSLAIIMAGDTIHITEGELDALILTHRCNLPAVGIAGATQWRAHYPRIFGDFNTTYVWGDGDPAGKEFAKHVAREVGAVIVNLPTDMDVSDLFVSEGPDSIVGRIL